MFLLSVPTQPPDDTNFYPHITASSSLLSSLLQSFLLPYSTFLLSYDQRLACLSSPLYFSFLSLLQLPYRSSYLWCHRSPICHLFPLLLFLPFPSLFPGNSYFFVSYICDYVTLPPPYILSPSAIITHDYLIQLTSLLRKLVFVYVLHPYIKTGSTRYLKDSHVRLHTHRQYQILALSE